MRLFTFRYLGTAAAEGIPAMFCGCDVCRRAQALGGRNLRLRSCALVNDGIMIDFSADMLASKHRYGLDLTRLEHIFFTHSHIDHLAANELCYIHRMYCGREADRPLHLYGNEKALDVIRAAYVFDTGRVPDSVRLHLLAPFQRIAADGMAITPLPAQHDPKEQCMIYLLERDGARMLYANDSAMLLEEVFAYLNGQRLDVVSLDCTCSRLPSGDSHMGFADNLLVRERLMEIGAADGRTAFLSHHFSHNSGVNYDDFAALAAGSPFVSSYDGMEIVVGDAHAHG